MKGGLITANVSSVSEGNYFPRKRLSENSTPQLAQTVHLSYFLPVWVHYKCLPIASLAVWVMKFITRIFDKVDLYELVLNDGLCLKLV